MKSHRLLDGRRVGLREFNAREQAFLTDLQRMARQGVSYFEVYRAAVGPGSPALQGRNRIDRRIVESPLYLVARDIATRVGIKRGLVLAPEHENKRATAPGDASMISVAQAAEFVGITRAAIYKAIEKGALEAIRIGNVTVVKRASAHAYRERRESVDRRESRARGTEASHGSETRRQRHAGSAVAPVAG
jgi:excisionase family DNA binding protein